MVKFTNLLLVAINSFLLRDALCTIVNDIVPSLVCCNIPKDALLYILLSASTFFLWPLFARKK